MTIPVEHNTISNVKIINFVVHVNDTHILNAETINIYCYKSIYQDFCTLNSQLVELSIGTDDNRNFNEYIFTSLSIVVCYSIIAMIIKCGHDMFNRSVDIHSNVNSNSIEIIYE